MAEPSAMAAKLALGIDSTLLMPEEQMRWFRNRLTDPATRWKLSYGADIARWSPPSRRRRKCGI